MDNIKNTLLLKSGETVRFKDKLLLKSGEIVKFNTAMTDLSTGENWFSSAVISPAGKMISLIKFTLDDVKEVI